MAMICVPLRERCLGRWHGILPALGIGHEYLTGKNGPCPCCGGKDRWRFLNTDGAGTWICNSCGTGGGTDLVMKFTGMPFREAAEKIQTLLGEAPVQSAKRERDSAQTRAALNAMWKCSAPIQRRDAVDRWLCGRGIALDVFPRCLRTATKLQYYDSGTSSFHPGMLAMVQAADGTPATLHRTYLTEAGAKAAVDTERKLFSSMPKGSAVRLAAAGAELGIAEGIETALAASVLFKLPTWAAICANGLANFVPPEGVERVFIFGDNDTNSVGQAAAYALASRLSASFRTEVHIPPDPGSDWNDVLCGGT
jgi:putative DNA primase/helicase